MYFVLVYKYKTYHKTELVYTHMVVVTTFAICVQYTVASTCMQQGQPGTSVFCQVNELAWCANRFNLAYLHMFLAFLRFLATCRITVFTVLKRSKLKLAASVLLLYAVAAWFAFAVKKYCDTLPSAVFCYDGFSVSYENVKCYGMTNTVAVLVIPSASVAIFYSVIVKKLNRNKSRLGIRCVRVFDHKKNVFSNVKRKKAFRIAPNVAQVTSALVSLILNIVVIFTSQSRRFWIKLMHIASITLQSFNPLVFFFYFIRDMKMKRLKSAQLRRIQCQQKLNNPDGLKRHRYDCEPVMQVCKKLDTIYEESAPFIPVLNKSVWLTNDQIYAFLKLLHAQFPSVLGLFDPTLFELEKFGEILTSADDNVVFICNVDNSHWATITNCLCEKNTWAVFDSLNYPAKYYENIFRKLLPNADKVTVDFMNLKNQDGFNDCGLFALAFATALCNKQDPCALSFNQSKLTHHYNVCVQSKCATMFPTHFKRSKAKYYESKRFDLFLRCFET